jgi:hypothetical protein
MILPLALVALGANSVTGKWVLEYAGRQTGASQPTVKPDLLDLKADGAMLTGSVTNHGFVGYPGATPPPPEVTPISRGKVDGSHIYFEVTRELGGHSFTTKYEGTVSGNRIDLNMTTTTRQGDESKAWTGTAGEARRYAVTHVVAKRL